MKKTYLQPETTKVKIVMDKSLLTISDPNATINDNGSVEAQDIDSNISNFSVWKDDEE